MVERARVMLCGCGQWAKSAHLPVLAKMSDRVSLTHVVELNDRAGNVREVLREKGIKDWEAVKIIGSGPDSVPESRMPAKGEVDACIVATISEQHLQYTRWSLQNGLHTLSDKPLSFHAWASTDPDKARSIASDYGDLTGLARQNGDPVFMLATQKRYQWAFHKMAERIEKVAETGYPVTSVDCATSDGYWMLPWEYTGQKFHSYDQGGGKLTHTGYHFLDIVPWLMRHSGLYGRNTITHAFITANLFRPSDSASLMKPEDIAYLVRAKNAGNATVADDLGDINSHIQVKFCNGKRFVTSVNFTFLHEGFSLRTTGDIGESVKGRTKIDHMAVSQGPVFYARFSRIAKMLDADAVSPIGRPDHFELDFIANNLTGLPRIEQLKPESPETYDGCGDDELPTTDFLEAVLDPARASRVISPVSDHKIGVQLMSAAYESAALSFREMDGRPVPVKIEFGPDDWEKPPAYWKK